MPRKEKCLFNESLNTFHLRVYGVGHMVTGHSNRVRGNGYITVPIWGGGGGVTGPISESI